MRRLHEAAPSNADASLPIRMFCYSVRNQLAALIAALDGVDLIVFTFGIGENDWEARAEICHGLAWFGIGLDEARNRSSKNPSAISLRAIA
jgi:acetate kinase